jgi:predicted nucleotidyltransferase
MEDDLMKLIQKAAEVLKSFGAKEVYLFGSIATDTYNENSDIDFAVSGLPPENFFPAMGGAGDVLKREMDLIDLDEKNPFTDYLKTEGELKRVG